MLRFVACPVPSLLSRGQVFILLAFALVALHISCTRCKDVLVVLSLRNTSVDATFLPGHLAWLLPRIDPFAVIVRSSCVPFAFFASPCAVMLSPGLYMFAHSNRQQQTASWLHS